MTDIASLVLKIDAAEADVAATSLDKMTQAGAKAEAAVTGVGTAGRAALGGLSAIPASLQQIEARTDTLRSSVDPLYAAQKRLNSQMAEADNLFRAGALGADEYQRTVGILDNQLNAVSQAQDRLNAMHVKGAAGTRLQTHEAANLGRQFADVGVMLASGQNPFMTLLQQGPQIADILHTSGLSVKDFAKEVGVMLGILKAVPAANAAVAASSVAVVAGNQAIAASATAAATAQAVALAPLGIILAGIALALATLGIGFAVTAQQIDKTGHSAKDLQAKLGLTEDQMKRLKKEGHEVGVTFGDVLVGTFDFAGKKLAEAFKWNDMKKAVGSFYQTAVDWTVTSIRSMVGAWAGFQGGLRAMFQSLPAAVGEFAIDAVNAAIKAINAGLAWITAKVNEVVGWVNLASSLVGLDLKLPEFDGAQLKELDNQFRGAGDKLGDSFSKGYKDSSTKAMAQFDKDVAGWLASIDAAWLKRNKKAAGEAGAGSKSGGSDQESDFERTMKQIAEAAVLTKAETATQRALNDAVAAGTITIEAANRERTISNELTRLQVAANAAEGEEAALLDKALKALRKSYEEANAEKDRFANLGAISGQNDQLEMLRLEASLIGAGNVERAIQLAQLREKQAIIASGGDPTTASSVQRIGGAGEVAASQAALAIGQDLYNKSLDYTYDRLTQIDDLVSNSMAGLAEAFDGMSDGAAKFTRALGGVLGAVNRLAIAEEKAAKERKQASKDLEEGVAVGKLLNDQELIKKARLEYAETSTKTTREIEDAQLSAYANMAGAAKSFFEEGSSGYKALQAAETAFRAVQMIMSIQAMIQNATETAAHVGNSQTKTVASATAGAANFFEQSGWAGFAGVAAMVAVLASFGFSGGGSASAQGYDLGAVQDRQGTGSVLGDSGAKSESISKSLGLVADHTNDMLEYNNQMLRALRAIESSITSVAAAIARSLGIGGALDPKGVEGLGTTNVNPRTFNSYDTVSALLLGGGSDPLNLFGMKTVKKLVDSGLSFVGQTLGDILAGGMDAAFFQTVETRVTKKAFGVTYSDKVKNKTLTTAVDEDLARQLGLIVSSMRDGVLTAASLLGVQGAGAVLDAFSVNLGQISFKGMKADEISSTLEAVFSKLGDDMAAAVIPGLTGLQQAGEGLFETLMRVARQYQVIDVTLASVGMTFGAVGLSSLAARERLVDLFGSLDDFTDQVSFYSENFLTEAERLAPVQAALTTELARLGITGLDTRDEFKALVQGLDLSSAAGAELFAALMAIAPAFAAITEETQAIADQRDRLSTAYERESSALADTKAQFQDLFKSLGSFKSSLYTGPSAALSPEAQYNASKGEFERIRGLALTGDVNALGDLQSVSQEYLDASRAYFASSQGYFADLEAVRSAVTAAEGIAGAQVDVAQQQLDALLNLVDPILNIRDDIGTVAAEMQRLNQLLGATTTNTPVVVGGISAGAVANDNTAVVQQIQQTNATLTELVATTNAAMEQQAAIHAADNSNQQQQINLLQRQVQEMQENRA